jgi:intergrase/recombinase
MSIKGNIEIERPQKRFYTPEELVSFDKEIEPYKIEGEIEGKKVMYFSVGGEFAYLQSLGIVRTYSGEKITPQMKTMSSMPECKVMDDRRFEEMENKIKQYFNHKAKGDYIFQRNIDDYEKIAKSFPPVLQEEEITTEDLEKSLLV